jgi:hypothetical protein
MDPDLLVEFLVESSPAPDLLPDPHASPSFFKDVDNLPLWM